jgi:endonuclease YncB( thermonuclease family)
MKKIQDPSWRFLKMTLAAIFSLFLIGAADARTEATYIDVKFVKVYDGDTIDVSYDGLPPPLNKMRIRLPGIDTPELGAKAKCDFENEAAEAARDFMAATLGKVDVIRVHSPRWDKYGGRINGKVYINNDPKKGLITDVMIKKGFARVYDGGKRQGWCD